MIRVELMIPLLIFTLIAIIFFRIRFEMRRLVKNPPASKQFHSRLEDLDYFLREPEGEKMSGFTFAFSVFNEKDGLTGLRYEPLEEIYALFIQRNGIAKSDLEIPQVYELGFLGPLPSVVIVIALSLHSSHEEQMRTTKMIAASWYECVDELYGGIRKGLVSIFYGDIQSTRSRRAIPISGIAFKHVIVAIGDAYMLQDWFPTMENHKIALDREAAIKLGVRLPEKLMSSVDDPECLMYGGDYQKGIF